MLNLIITIIAIALVAVLTATSVYYGGSAFSEGTANAISATFINQVQQIQASAIIFRSREGGDPTSIDQLSPNYLSSLPVISGDSSQNWLIGTDMSGDSYIIASQPITATFENGITLEVCEIINEDGANLINCFDGGAAITNAFDAAESAERRDEISGLSTNVVISMPL